MLRRRLRRWSRRRPELSRAGNAGLLALVLIVGASCAPTWTRGVSYNPYYYQGVGVSPSVEGADQTAFADIGLEMNGAKVRSSLEVVTGSEYSGKERVRQSVTDSTAVSVNAVLRRGAKVVERHHGSDGLCYSYAVLPRPGVQNNIAFHARAVRLRAFAPGLAQFNKGQQSRGLFFILATAGGTAGAFVLDNLKKDARSSREAAQSQAEWDFYNRRANLCRDASIVSAVFAGTFYAVNVLDGMFSKPSPGHAYFGYAGDGGLRVSYAWRF